MFGKKRYRTARAVIHCQDQYLLAVHSSFWARRERRWGLLGGAIEWGESAEQAVQRELQEELSLQLHEFAEIGAFSYKGAQHMVFGTHTDAQIQTYDTNELLDIGWFSLTEIQALADTRKLHAGYELHAIQQFINSSRGPMQA
ncbi:MAG: NUDIX hydrolase [Pseudomonadota bacterium]